MKTFLWEHKHDIESNNQYNRRNNLEISGIPNNSEDDDLETKAVEVLKKINVIVKKEEIEACHRLPAKNSKNKKAIVRFTNRKTCSRALMSRNKLSGLNLTDLNLDNNKYLYISENLNRYFQGICFVCRKLKCGKLIQIKKITL